MQAKDLPDTAPSLASDDDDPPVHLERLRYPETADVNLLKSGKIHLKSTYFSNNITYAI